MGRKKRLGRLGKTEDEPQTGFPYETSFFMKKNYNYFRHYKLVFSDQLYSWWGLVVI